MAPYNIIPGINDYFVKRPIPGRQYMETGSIPCKYSHIAFAHRAVLLGLMRRSIIIIINLIGDPDFVSFIAGQTCRPGVRS